MTQNVSLLNQDLLIVTEAAQNHFRELIQKEETEGMNLRVFAANPGTPSAEISVTFCPPGEQMPTDFPLDFQDFILFVEEGSENALRDAAIDFKGDSLGGQLSIKAPYLKGQAPKPDTPLKERIQYVIDSEINPGLAGHRGRVKLVDIVEEKIVVLQFGGGCQGCGMADITLKNGIEKILKEKFPELVEIRDITDHTMGENPYY